jgi:hypothetical protein
MGWLLHNNLEVRRPKVVPLTPGAYFLDHCHSSEPAEEPKIFQTFWTEPIEENRLFVLRVSEKVTHKFSGRFTLVFAISALCQICWQRAEMGAQYVSLPNPKARRRQ